MNTVHPLSFRWLTKGLMKKKIIDWFLCIFLVAGCCGWYGYGQGVSGLADKTADCIADYFSGAFNVKAAVIKFENLSGLSGLTAQKFYQLLAARLETSEKIAFTDVMVNFHQNKGVFNLNRIHALNHLIYIKLTRNKNKIGAGISIFSRNLDKIVYIKYVEAVFTEAEREIFDTDRYGFTGAGFSRIIELEAQPGLLDLKSLLDREGRLSVLYYYPGNIDFFRLDGSRLIKFLSYPLQWRRPYYPVMTPEGKLAAFWEKDVLYVSAGGNFSRKSKLLAFTDIQPEGETKVDVFELDFAVFRRVVLNGSRFLAGARWAVGKNYFANRLILAPWETGLLTGENRDYLVKDVPWFYALDFSTAGGDGVLNSIHIVDRDYNYRFLADNFEELTVEENKRGAALCCRNGQWLAVSDYSRGGDKLFFYKIEEGGRSLVFENNIDGEVVFISDGLWKAASGFWVYVKKKHPGYEEYKLQFWSKKSD
jgi:hypothetical protein